MKWRGSFDLQSTLLIVGLQLGFQSALCWAGDVSAPSNDGSFACVPTGYSALVTWPDSLGLQSGAFLQPRVYPEVSRADIFRAFVDRMQASGVFRKLDERRQDIHDFSLVFHLDRVERRPISGPDDLLVEAFVDLVEPRFRQSLWSAPVRVVIEVRTLNPAVAVQPIVAPVMAKLAGTRLADGAVVRLNRFLKDGGLGKLGYAKKPACPARTVIAVISSGIPFADEDELFSALSVSPCLALDRVEVERSGADSSAGLFLWAVADSASQSVVISIHDPATELEIYRGGWRDAETAGRDRVLGDILNKITAYHHRLGPCLHDKYAR